LTGEGQEKKEKKKMKKAAKGLRTTGGGPIRLRLL